MAGGAKKSKPAGPVKAFGREYNKNKGKIDRSRNYDEEDIIKRNQESSGSEESGSEESSGSENETKNKKSVSKLGSDSSDDEVVVSRNPNKPQQTKRSLKPVAGAKKGKAESDDEDSEEEDSDDDEVANPNRIKQVTQKVSQINMNAKVELSRREKEEIARQAASLRANEKQQKSDLERLQVIRKQREEQAKRKEEEKKAQEEKMAERRRLGLQ